MRRAFHKLWSALQLLLAFALLCGVLACGAYCQSGPPPYMDQDLVQDWLDGEVR